MLQVFCIRNNFYCFSVANYAVLLNQLYIYLFVFITMSSSYFHLMWIKFGTCIITCFPSLGLTQWRICGMEINYFILHSFHSIISVGRCFKICFKCQKLVVASLWPYIYILTSKVFTPIQIMWGEWVSCNC